MSVYVDPMCNCLAGPKWPWGESCHLFADSTDELHYFAIRLLGLQRSWFQHRPGKLPHYDLTRRKRGQAVACGAVELDARAAVKLWHEKGWR